MARITWTENDYRANEADLQVVGIIQTSATLARDITIRVSPLTYTQAMEIDDLEIPVNLPPAATCKYTLAVYLNCATISVPLLTCSD